MGDTDPTEIVVEQGGIQSVDSPVVIVNLFRGVTDPGGATGAVDAATDGAISHLISTGDLEGKHEETAVLHPRDASFDRVIVVGLGEREEFTLQRAREASAVAARKARSLGVDEAHTIVHGAGVGGFDASEAAQALAEGALLGLYRFRRYKTEHEGDGDDASDDEGDGSKTLDRLVVVEFDEGKLDAVREGVTRGRTVAGSVNVARDLAAWSGDDAAPTHLAEEATRIADEVGLGVKVLDETDLEEGGFGGILGVARGSAKPPRLVVLEHNADRARELPTIVLAGKGVTFDTGGISIKSSKNMERMRHDKSAAAAVVGTLRAAGLMDLPLHVVGLMPFAENMPGSNAVKPGDVLTSYGGKTIEVINTDAEGRLLLADTLGYADGFDPDVVVDLATLTGSVTYALGDQAGGLMGPDEHAWLLERIEDAGEATGERVWRLPFYDAYDSQLESEYADVKNTGGHPGATIAGRFLHHFVGDWPWAHLDIANVSYPKGGSGKGYNKTLNKGPTYGTGVRLMLHVLEHWEEG